MAISAHNSTHNKSSNITSRLILSRIKEATTTGRAIAIWDGELRGFGARISPTGRVTWIASKAIGRGKGSTQRVVVGHYPGMPLDQARMEAGQVIARLAKGEDVISQVKQAKVAKIESRQCPTVKEAVADYLDGRKHNPKLTPGSRYETEVAGLFHRQYVPELGASTRLNAVIKADIKAMLKKRNDAGHYGAARFLMASLRPFFDWCIHEDYISANPCADLKAPPPPRRLHRLNTQEIVTLWSASSCASDTFPIIGAYWRLLLMLLQRRCEVGGLRWREVDLDRAEWIIPGSRTKNKREHLIPLPRQAVAELQALGPKSGESDFIFGRFGTSPLSGFSQAKEEIDAVMLARATEINVVVRPWRIHDLRRTGASLMSGVKVHGRTVPPHIIEAVLNHTPGTLEGTYQVWNLYKYAEEKREALQAWVDHLDRVVVSNSPSRLIVATPVISNIPAPRVE